MKLKVLYFAWLKGKVGRASEAVETPDEVETVADLIAWLKLRSAGHGDAFAELSVVRCAVNLDYVDPGAHLKDGDEVGFFPPVTGG